MFNAEGKPLTPGFFAGITSIGITEVSAVEESADAGLALKEMRPEFDVVPAYNPQSSLVPVTRIEGFSFTLLGANTTGSIFGGQGPVVMLDGGYESFIGRPGFVHQRGRRCQQTEWWLTRRPMDAAEPGHAGS